MSHVQCMTCGGSFLRSEMKAGKYKSGAQCATCAPEAKTPLETPIRPAPKFAGSANGPSGCWVVATLNGKKVYLKSGAPPVAWIDSSADAVYDDWPGSSQKCRWATRNDKSGATDIHIETDQGQRVPLHR